MFSPLFEGELIIYINLESLRMKTCLLLGINMFYSERSYRNPSKNVEPWTMIFMAKSLLRKTNKIIPSVND